LRRWSVFCIIISNTISVKNCKYIFYKITIIPFFKIFNLYSNSFCLAWCSHTLTTDAPSPLSVFFSTPRAHVQHDTTTHSPYSRTKVRYAIPVIAVPSGLLSKQYFEYPAIVAFFQFIFSRLYPWLGAKTSEQWLCAVRVRFGVKKTATRVHCAVCLRVVLKKTPRAAMRCQLWGAGTPSEAQHLARRWGGG
jgi:hypothetical protein